GIVDLINMKAITYGDDLGQQINHVEIPEDMRDLADEYREMLLDSISEYDDELMMKYLEGEDITAEEIKKVIRKATIDGKITPVLCGSSYKNKGVQPLLDAIVEFLPSPIDIPPVKGVSVDGDETLERHSSDDEPFSALAFKIVT